MLRSSTTVKKKASSLIYILYICLLRPQKSKFLQGLLFLGVTFGHWNFFTAGNWNKKCSSLNTFHWFFLKIQHYIGKARILNWYFILLFKNFTFRPSKSKFPPNIYSHFWSLQNYTVKTTGTVSNCLIKGTWAAWKRPKKVKGQKLKWIFKPLKVKISKKL